MYYKSLNLDA